MKKAAIIFIIIFLFMPSLLYSFPKKKLNSVIAEFEEANPGSAVVIYDPESGEIEYVYNAEYALRKRFPPGSIAKVWSAVVLLENRNLLRFNPLETVLCRGKFFIPDEIILTNSDKRIFNLPVDKKSKKRYFRCALAKGHGRVNLFDAIIQSCNTYFLTMSSRNPAGFYDLLERTWHLNENTSARLADIYELPGRPKKNLSQFQSAAASIGEGGAVQVSLLKVAQTFGAFFEKTPLLSPFQKPFKKKFQQFPLSVSAANRNQVISALSRTLKSGTLKNFKKTNSKVKIIAGKTGTGTHNKKKYASHGWNVLYFKYKRKKYILVSFVNNGSGSGEALKLSGKVFNAL